jgi:hypothetical protein
LHVGAITQQHSTTLSTGFQHGELHHYMENKADLLIAIHARFIAPLLVEAREVAASADFANIKLRRIATVLMNDVARDRGQVTVFLHEWRIIYDIGFTSFTLLGMINHSYQWYDPNGRISPDDAAGKFADIFLRRILTRETCE